MKKIFTLLIALFLWASLAQAVTVQIGTGTTNSTYFPIYSCYDFNYSQQIYLVSEINNGGGGAGPITAIRFFYSSGGTTLANWSNWTVYLGNTAKTVFSGSTDWVPVSLMTPVFTGAIPTPVAGTWITLTLSTPFNYTGGNLVVGVDENSSGYSCTANWGSFTSTSLMGILYYADGTNPDPAAPPTANYTSSTSRAQVQFEMAAYNPVTPPNCATIVSPANAATGIFTSQTLNWANGGGAPTGYKMYFGTDPSPAYIGDLGNVTTYAPTLSWGTTYYWKVVPYNANGDATGCSTWSFSTSPDPSITSFPYCQDFTTPTNWTVQQISGTGNWATYAAGTYPTCSAHSASTMAGFNSYNYSVGVSSILNTPPLNLPSSLYRVKFWMYRDDGYPSNADLVNVYYNTTASLTGATLLGTINRNYLMAPAEATANAWYEYSFNMPAGSAGNGRYVIFNAVSAYGNNIWMDDVCVEEQPACPNPTALNVSGITSTSATFGWTPGGSETSWIVEYGLNGYNHVGGTTIDPATNPQATTTTLTANTPYQFYVKANCGGGSLSPWAGPYSFTTGCAEVSTFSENFDGVTTPAFPACWGKVGSVGNAYTTTTNYSAPNSLYCYGYSGSNPVIKMPPVNNAGANTHQLRFYMMNYSDPIEVGYLTDPTNAASFVMVQSILGPNGVWTEQTVNLGTAPGAATTLAFRANGLNYSSIYIDNVFWEPKPACPAPTVLTATNIDGHNATFGWTENGTATQWNVQWGANGFVLGTGTIIPATNPMILSGLSPTTAYAYYVQADCGGGSLSTWSGPKTFSTTVACPQPTGLTASGITTTEATLSWDDPMAGIYNVAWGPAPFGPPTAPTPGYEGLENNVLLSSLNPATTYVYYVQRDCGGTDGVSLWSGPYTFNTGCNIVSVFPYTQNFNAVTAPALPPCITQNNANADGDLWATYATYGVGSTPCAAIYTDYNAGANNDYLILPQFTLSNNQRLKFAFRSWSTFEPNDFEVLLSTTDNLPASFTTTLLPLTQAPLATFTETSWIDLSGYSGNVYIAIHVPAGGLDGWYLMVDDILVEDIPSCLYPTALTATGITDNAASFGWTPGGSETSWVVEYGLNGYNHIGGTTINPATNPQATIATLTANTAYQFYVKADCGGAGLSPWAGPYSFTTLGPVLSVVPTSLALGYAPLGSSTLPQTFAVSGNYLASGIVTVTAPAGFEVYDGANWVSFFDITFTPSTLTSTNVQVRCTPLAANTSYSGNVTIASAGAVTQNVAVTGSSSIIYCVSNFTSVTYEFITNVTYGGINNTSGANIGGPVDYTAQVANVNQGVASDISVTMDPDANDYIYAFIDWNQNGTLNDAGEVYTVVANSSAAGPHTVSIAVPLTATLGNTRMRVMVDWNNAVPNPCRSATFGEAEDYTVNVGAAPPCPQPTTLASTSTATTANLTWTPGNTETAWEYVYGVSPLAPPAGAGTATTSNTVNPIGPLTANSTYQYYVRANCGGTFSPWTGPYTFKTGLECPSGSYLETEVCGTDANGGCNMVTPAWETVTLGQTMCGTSWCNGSSRDTDWGTFTLTQTTTVTLTVLAQFDVAFGFIASPCPATAFLVSNTALAGATGTVSTTLAAGTYYSFVAPSAFTTIITCGNGNDFQATVTGNTCVPPTALAATAITTTSMNLSWTPAGTETAWEYAYGVAPFTAPGSGTATSSSTTNAVTVAASTTYQYYVRADCGGTYSPWAGPFTFSAPLCLPSAQCNYTFNLTDSYGDGWNGGTMQVLQGGLVVATLGSAFTTGSAYTETVALCDGIAFDLYWNTAGDFPEEMGLNIVDPAAATIYTVVPDASALAGTTLYTGTGTCPVTTKTLNLTVLLEGLYDATAPGTMREAQNDVGSQWPGNADKIEVYLYDATLTLVYSNLDVNLSTSGLAVMTDITGSLNDSYWIVVKHRNSIETWSSAVVDFSGAGPIGYDFTDAATKAYGDNMKQFGSYYAIWAGDASKDGKVDIDDMTLIDNASQGGGLLGYNDEDCNGDGKVDIDDMTIIDNNSQNGGKVVMKP